MEVIASVTSNAGSVAALAKKGSLLYMATYIAPSQYSVPVAKHSMYILFIIFICNMFLYLTF